MITEADRMAAIAELCRRGHRPITEASFSIFGIRIMRMTLRGWF